MICSLMLIKKCEHFLSVEKKSNVAVSDKLSVAYSLSLKNPSANPELFPSGNGHVSRWKHARCLVTDSYIRTTDINIITACKQRIKNLFSFLLKKPSSWQKNCIDTIPVYQQIFHLSSSLMANLI